MFDKKSMDIYKDITAPDSLRKRVLNLQASTGAKPKLFPPLHTRRWAYSLAASVLVIFLFSLAAVNFGSVKLTVCGQPAGDSPVLVMTGRSVMPFSADPTMAGELLSIPLELGTHRQTELKVSAGRLVVLDDSTGEERMSATTLKLSKNQQLYWVLEDAAKTGSAQLIITAGQQKTTYVLSRNDSKGLWAITKQKSDRQK